MVKSGKEFLQSKKKVLTVAAIAVAAIVGIAVTLAVVLRKDDTTPASGSTVSTENAQNGGGIRGSADDANGENNRGEYIDTGSMTDNYQNIDTDNTPATAAPVQSPVEFAVDSAPTRPPTDAPVPSSTAAPTLPPALALTIPPTNAPVQTPLPTVGANEFEDNPFLACLGETGIDEIVVPTSANYGPAMQCLIWEPQNFGWAPSAIVKPATPEEVAAAVKCAAANGITVSARSGSHGFQADSCRGELIVDMSLHDSVEVTTGDMGDSVAIFGAGQLHGHLYSELSKYGLVTPGGTESMVGVGGLWLGCGRGLLSQVFGYSCDHVLAVEYVDAEGNLEWADYQNNDDMYWMARGSGGLFPGIVTKFIVETHPVPRVIKEDVCYFALHDLRLVIDVWMKYLDLYNDPNSSMFSGIVFDREKVKIDWNCWDCDEIQLGKYTELQQATFGEIAALSKNDTNVCDEHQSYDWTEKLLSRGWDTYTAAGDLTSRSEWPEWKDADGLDLVGSAYNGAVMVPNASPITPEIIDAIIEYTENYPGEREDRKYLDSIVLYPMAGKGVLDVNPLDTAYGARDTKLVIHFKMDKVDENPAVYKSYMDNFERKLVFDLGLPCLSFYNYADGDFACANTELENLGAFFSDPPRVKQIVEQRDPNRVFYRTML